MDGFAMREWLTIIIGVAILAVVLDGIRRMRHSRANSIRSSDNVSDDNYEPATYGSELPSGGARVVGQRDESEAERLNSSVKQAYAASRTTKGFRIPEQVTLNLDETVPMLMDSVAEPKNPRKAVPLEPTLGDLDEIGEDLNHPEPSVSELDFQAGGEMDQAISAASADETEPSKSSASQAYEHAVEPDLFASEPVASEPVASTSAEPEQLQLDSYEEPVTDYKKESVAPNAAESEGIDAACVEPEEVFVINIMAPKGFYFAGQDLLELAVEAGFRLGEMNIFHRHHRMDGSGPILFSMANIVMPGTFDLQKMSEFKTPGVSMFLTLPCSAKSMDAFELLYGTADYLADNLGGDLKDEQRNKLTAQTVEHYRQRIRDYERQSLMHKS